MQPILPIKASINIDTTLNFNGHGDITCKQTFNVAFRIRDWLAVWTGPDVLTNISRNKNRCIRHLYIILCNISFSTILQLFVLYKP